MKQLFLHGTITERIVALLALLLLPTIPVLILYWLFDGMNYFELEDTARGVVATGPIAAYVALFVLAGWTYQRLASPAQVMGGADLSTVLGTWDFEAVSTRGQQVRTGSFTVESRYGRLEVGGQFKADGKPVGQFDSKLAQLDGDKFTFVYDLEDRALDPPAVSKGLTTMRVDPADRNVMTGLWALIGTAASSGSISCTRNR